MFNFEKLVTSQWLIKRAFQFSQLGQTFGSNLGENIGGFVGNAIGGKNLGQLIGKYYGAGDFLGGAAGSLMGGQRLGNIAGKNIGGQIGQNIGNVFDKGLGLLSQKVDNINIASGITQRGTSMLPGKSNDNSGFPVTPYPGGSGRSNFAPLNRMPRAPLLTPGFSQGGTLPYKIDKNKPREGVYNPLKPNTEQNNPSWSTHLLPYSLKNPPQGSAELL